MSSTLDWANLFEEEAPRLMRFLRRFGPRISPEDISQDAFAKLCAAKTGEIANPQAYLMTTARNLALNDLRRQANHKTDASAGIETFAPASAADPEADLIASEQASAAEAALAALAPHLREALLLHIIEGLTQPEAAARLGVSRRTLQRYIETALAKLALALADPDT
ncbi:MAG: RNA polymerase subunit sigma-24 [Alphaproteobacteria bacterium]|nr:MAG: RNA polymerase subunit sigma-24 [Alphaproteobacteria bacterium]